MQPLCDHAHCSLEMAAKTAGGEEISGMSRRLQNAVEPLARKVEAAVDELQGRSVGT